MSFGSTLIKGTRITDFTQTSAEVGKPIPFGYGRFVVSGNVIFAKLPPKETRHVQKQGKGGGVKQESFTYSTSYAIAFCKGEIQGYLWIKRNGKLVYSSDPNAPVEDKDYSTKWLRKSTLYNGTMEQMPDSTIESVVGIGKVSAFRGLAYIVLNDDDVTEGGGAVPNYEACVIATPPEAYLTSKPYPQLWADEADVGASLQMTMRDVLIYGEQEADAVTTGLKVRGGLLRNSLQNGEADPDNVTTGLAPRGGLLKLSPKGEAEPDAVTTGLEPRGGLLKLSPKGTQAPDAITTGLAPRGGELVDLREPANYVNQDGDSYTDQNGDNYNDLRLPT